MASGHAEPCQAREPSTPPTPTVTNIFKKVENVFVTNSLPDAHVNQHALHKKKCSVHQDRLVDFVCVVCNENICQLCKLSEHEGHETKSISLAAKEAKTMLMSVVSGQIKQHEQIVRNILEERKAQMQDLVQSETATKDKIKERCDHLQCLVGIKSPEATALLVRTFQQRFSAAQINSKRRKKKRVSASRFNCEETMSAIRLRQDLLVSMIGEEKKQQTAHLKALKTEASSGLEECIKTIEEELDVTAQLREEMDAVMTDKDHVNILHLYRQAAADFNAERLRVRLCKLFPASRWLLCHEASEDMDEHDFISDIFWNDRKEVVETYIQKFLGRVVTQPVAVGKGVDGIAVQLKPAFRCSEESQAVVKSLCPLEEQRIIVSFSAQPDEAKGQTKTFHESGKEVELHSFGLSTVTTISKPKGGASVHFLPLDCGSLSAPMAASASLFAKHEKHYVLKTSHEDTEHRFNFYIIYLDESGCLMETVLDEYSSKMSQHTTAAFDASKSGESFAVVNIVSKNTYNAHGFQDGVRYDRELLILDRGHDGSLEGYRYEPPTANFSPTDVCFLDVNGEEVLAVADMGTGSIHLSRRSCESGKYIFARYLTEDRLLACPTALNTDSSERLWVGCKGGHLYIAEIGVHDWEQPGNRGLERAM